MGYPDDKIGFDHGIEIAAETPLHKAVYRAAIKHLDATPGQNLFESPAYARIMPGQQLRLVKPRQATTTAAAPKPQTKPAKAKPKSKAVVADNTRYRDPKKWLWPTKGKLLNTFLASDLDRRGIDIAGKLGQPVIAVADGKVVYSGNGLAGYGNLIIIKHSDTYLSAYAHCQERLVREGMQVKAGKMVARMGRKDNTAKLHFEIRRNGKPVDPIKYLPDR